MSDSLNLPPKPEVCQALLQSSSSVYVHLDPRDESVSVPSWFRDQPQLVLQIGLNMAVPIPDLDVGDEALSCTLSFNRTPELCRIPWRAIYGLVGEDGRGMIWPDSVPEEVAAAAERRPGPDASTNPNPSPSAGLRLASSEGESVSAEAEPEEAEAKAAPVEGAPAEPLSPPASERPATADGEVAQKADKQEAATTGTSKKSLPPYLRVVK